MGFYRILHKGVLGPEWVFGFRVWGAEVFAVKEISG